MTHAISFGCRGLSVRVPGRNLVDELDVEVVAGQFLAVLGQNGTGKSLTLHTLAGLRQSDAGTVTIDRFDLSQINRRQLSQQLALLPQYTEDIFPSTVIDSVLIGRHPHIGRLQWETTEDRNIAREALHQMDLGDFPQRDISTLSGGERRRAAIAQVLVQQPNVYLLDEPTNHLDPQHQLEVLTLFVRKAREGAIVVASLHDVNLAARYADRCLLLFGDGRWELGDTNTVLTEEKLSDLYGTRMESVRWQDVQLFVAAG